MNDTGLWKEIIGLVTAVIGFGTAIIVFGTAIIGLVAAVIGPSTAILVTAVIVLVTVVLVTAIVIGLIGAIRRHMKKVEKIKDALSQPAAGTAAHMAKARTAKAIRGREGARPSSPREVTERHSRDLKSFLETVDKIRSNSGEEFLNLDQGHPAYAAGRRGRTNVQLYGDGPEENPLFRRLQRFPDEYHEEIQDLRTWQNFCAFAVAAYERHRLR